jgi:acyl carrier protein
MDRQSLRDVLRSKVTGTCILHRLTGALPLDFFVLFSSVSAAWGSGTLADDAGANAFLDAFAHRRGRWACRPERQLGSVGRRRPGAEAGRGRALELMGLRPLRIDAGLDALGRLLGTAATWAVVADVDWVTFKALYARGGLRPFLDEIPDEPVRPASRPVPRRRPCCTCGRRPRAARGDPDRYVRGRIAGVLQIPPEKIDPDRPLHAMGLDSLTAMELKGAIEADLGAVLPLGRLLEGPSVVQLAELALEGVSGLAASPTAPPAPGPAREVVSEHPLSAGQQALWYLHQLAPAGAAYHIAGAGADPGGAGRGEP